MGHEVFKPSVSALGFFFSCLKLNYQFSIFFLFENYLNEKKIAAFAC